jgi:hypothetical protein
MTVRTQNYTLIQEEIKRRLNSGNACYHSAQKLLSSHLLLMSSKIRINKTIVLPVLLNGPETWPLTLKEEHRLRVFGNSVVRGIFGPKRDEAMGRWRKLHDENMQMRERKTTYMLLIGPEGKRPLGRQRHKWMDNIKIYLVEIGQSGVGWIGLTQDRYKWRALVNTVVNLLVPLNPGKLPSGCTTGGPSSNTRLHMISQSSELFHI